MIRSITNDDIDEVNRIVKDYDRNFIHHYKLEQYIDNNIYKINVYEEDNVLKGFIIATFIQNTLEILLVFIEKKYRNQKIASKLITDMLTNNNYDSVLLEVSVENEIALKLYDKFGFKIINTRKKYYDGIDAYVMEKVK